MKLRPPVEPRRKQGGFLSMGPGFQTQEAPPAGGATFVQRLTAPATFAGPSVTWTMAGLAALGGGTGVAPTTGNLVIIGFECPLNTLETPSSVTAQPGGEAFTNTSGTQDRTYSTLPIRVHWWAITVPSGMTGVRITWATNRTQAASIIAEVSGFHASYYSATGFANNAFSDGTHSVSITTLNANELVLCYCKASTTPASAGGSVGSGWGLNQEGTSSPFFLTNTSATGSAGAKTPNWSPGSGNGTSSLMVAISIRGA